MFRLHNPIRDYAWGSRTTLAELQGRPAPTAEPEAELWIGAHPTAPSLIDGGGGTTLLDLIGSDPTGTLGPDLDRLPFLLKLLAVERPLSLQVHPDAAQAAAGFAAEQAAGVAPDDPHRSYHDDQPKPELICALTPFTALCGFADPAQSAALLGSLHIDALHGVVQYLRTGDLRGAVTTLLNWPEAERAGLVAQVLAACTTRTGPRAAWTAALARAYPHDTGVITSMLLNLVELRPGEALHLPGRTLHAYLYGTGVEIMAASDNVLRGGLTSKYVDIGELLTITDFRATPPGRIHPAPTANHGETYPAPAPQFRLSRYQVRPQRPITLHRPGPGVLLCLGDEITVRRDADATTLTPGLSVFLPHRGGPVELTGSGVAYHATPGFHGAHT
ncbi:mannose-6-phosphate isomerase, class I [Kitasatospora paracochleata]|uniref:mannose-6-phosphate isomerase, class I n=1 Tax=Kitasatospora paracochleata TaxID=58354 RepID=UPI0020A3AF37